MQIVSLIFLPFVDSPVDSQTVDVGDIPGVPKQMKPPPDNQIKIGYKQDDDKNKVRWSWITLCWKQTFTLVNKHRVTHPIIK